MGFGGFFSDSSDHEGRDCAGYCNADESDDDDERAHRSTPASAAGSGSITTCRGLVE